jgi:phage terminase small subunit
MGIRGFVAESAVTGGPAVDVRPPSWLTASQRKIFRELVADAQAARINLAQLDAESFAVAATYIEAYRKTPDVRTGRDLIALLREIGATPMARARLAIKPDTDKKSKMAQILKMAPAKSA